MDYQYTPGTFPADSLPAAPYIYIPMGTPGCQSCPWAQTPNTMADPAEQVYPLQQGPPTGPPPSFTPTEQPTPFAVDPGAISFCLFRFTYLWLRNGQQFWSFLVFVGRTSVAGWRFDERRRRWSYFGVGLREIRSFQCF